MMVEDEFGESGRSVVIEEHMEGEETSIFALCDGAAYRLMVSSQDHKRAFDGDTGPNTGGMGAYAPAPVASPAILETVERTIIRPAIDGMASENRLYKGLLYAGIIVTANGPKVIEFNCRFGDPETQAVLPLLDGDLGEIMLACASGSLETIALKTSDRSALCIVMASGGYPGHYEKGKVITGLEDAASVEGAFVFHAGTKRTGNSIVTAGGRVLGITGTGSTFSEARSRAYTAAGKIAFEGSFYRNDIGEKALKYFTPHQ
jgi:phosphoribosylamine--glycine ligase